MPPLLDPILTLIAVFAAFFFLAWLLARDSLSRTARFWGWVSVAVTLIAAGWSLWFETLEPCLRTGRVTLAFLAVLQVVVAVVGMVLTVAGAVRFLRSWASMGWYVSSMRRFLESSPEFERIRSQPDARTRWKMAGVLTGRVLLLPGLGWVPLGMGITILAFQFLEPDRFLHPNPTVVYVGLGSVAVGLAQIIANALLVKKETKDGERAKDARKY